MAFKTSPSWANIYLNENRLKKTARKSPVLTPGQRQVPVMKAKDGVHEQKPEDFMDMIVFG